LASLSSSDYVSGNAALTLTFSVAEPREPSATHDD